MYSRLNLNQDKATKPQTVQIVRQGEATPYWFKFNPLYIIQALKIVIDIRASAEHGFMRLTDGQPVEHQPLGLVTVDNPYPAFQFRRVVVESIFKRKPAVGLQVDDGKHIVRNIHADADEFR